MKQQHIFYCLYCAGSLILNCLAAAKPSWGQVVPDETLPVNSMIIENGNSIRIEGGTQAGGNLFHSFQEFSLTAGQEAFFNNPLEIQNIISRVTGGTISNIDGLLRANGSANLFLLNPVGIVFGPNAQLNIGGSFLATSADSFILGEGLEYSATNPLAPPLLTVNVPTGLQFGANPGAIVNQSQATSNMPSNMPLPALDTPIPTPANVGLEVLPGHTLALIGGDVFLENGNLTASQGEIQLGSVASPGTVSFTPTATGLAFGYEGIASGIERENANFGNIELSGLATVNASGLGSGAIRLRGGEVTLREGASLIAASLGNQDGETIDIQSDRFRLQDRALISAIAFGEGAGADLTIRARESVELAGSGFQDLVNIQISAVVASIQTSDLESGLVVASQGNGNAGTLTIDTGQFTMSNGFLISTAASGSGDGGNVVARASESIEIIASTLGTGTLRGSTGNAGDAIAQTQRLVLRDGGFINVSTFAAGAAGNLVVNASESVEMLGTPVGAVSPTGLFANSIFDTGSGGNIEVNTKRLTIIDGAQIGNQSGALLGTGLVPLGGLGGNIVVNASESVELARPSPDGLFNGGIINITYSGFPAGDLTVSTRNLIVREGASISNSTVSAGRSGTMTITASDSLILTGAGTTNRLGAVTTSPSGLTSSSGLAEFPNLEATGAGGDLRINAGELIIRDGAQIAVNSFGSGDAGSLEIVADSLQLDGGTLSAATVSGAGGNMTVRLQEDLQLRRGSSITTNAGNTDGGNIVINVENLAALENSDITANAEQGRGGRVSINARGVFGTVFREAPTPDSDITATSDLGAQFSGTVEINTPEVDTNAGLVELDEEVVDVSKLISQNFCSAGAGSEFTVTGRGGLPSSPNEVLNPDTVLDDLRPVPINTSRVEMGSDRRLTPEETESGDRSLTLEETESGKSAAFKETIVEAQGWIVDADGAVVLVANPPQTNPQSPWLSLPVCR